MLLRSRAGCPRCRTKKIKCDESRPECHQCLKRGVSCPGYKQGLRWSHKHEVYGAQMWEGSSGGGAATPPEAVAPTLLESNLPATTFPSQLGVHSTQSLSAQTVRLSTRPTLSSPTLSQHTAEPGLLSSTVADKIDNYDDRSSTDVFRDDLREWLVSHEPMTLLQQHDWTWTLNEPTAGCDESSPFNVPITGRDTAASQGSDMNQALVQYFFDNLCCIHSVLDDTAERFKALVNRYLSSSPLLHKSIVCMSAVHCFQDEESMLPICLECHSAAVRSLSEAVYQIETVIAQSTDSPGNSVLSENNMLRKLEETLLASIILGFCAPWSDPGDLGLPHLRGARKLCEHLINYDFMDGKSPEKALINSDHNFLIGAMAYWEACTAFVVDQPKAVVQYLTPFAQPTGITYIHMFAGISLPLFVTLAKAGICVRQSKALRNMAALGWKDGDAYQSVAAEVQKDAVELERFAVEYQLPPDDTFDTKTLGTSTYRQIKAFAQMCKFAILLELQRNFPALVDPDTDDIQASSTETRSMVRRVDLERRYFDLSGAVLSHAQDIPEGSTSGLYQTLLLIICGSVLRTSTYMRPSFPEQLSLREQLEAQVLSTLARSDQIEQRRAFVRQRLQTNCASFGLRRVYSRAELLLEGVWKEFDSTSSGCYSSRHWIDFMAEHKLETFFG